MEAPDKQLLGPDGEPIRSAIRSDRDIGAFPPPPEKPPSVIYAKPQMDAVRGKSRGAAANAARTARRKASREDPEGTALVDALDAKPNKGGRPAGRRTRPRADRLLDKAIDALLRKQKEWWDNRTEHFYSRLFAHFTPKAAPGVVPTIEGNKTYVLEFDTMEGGPPVRAPIRAGSGGADLETAESKKPGSLAPSVSARDLLDLANLGDPDARAAIEKLAEKAVELKATNPQGPRPRRPR